MAGCSLILLSIFVYLASNIQSSFEISCKDENNNDVDWFINYKLPKIEQEPKGSNLNRGRAYAYLTSTSAKWQLSSISVDSPQSMLGRTWEDFKNKINKDVAYLFYNDDPPHGSNGTAVGHLKGSVIFDKDSGYWLTHSIPRFGRKDKYEYPSSAFTNGQIAMCMTFETKYFNEVCNHLLYCHPNIYESKIASSLTEFLDTTANSIFTEKPSFIRRADLRETKLKSSRGEQFVAFAKDNQLNVELYRDIVAPKLKTDLLTETWRRGAGTNLQPSCQTDYSVIDISSINLSVSNRRERIPFISKEDHSKWAISADRGKSWVCIADLNRMKSQEKRGGGAVCFRSKTAWKAFRSCINDTENCPT